MDALLMDKLTDRVNKLIARCQELERLNQELVDSQQQLLTERGAMIKMNQHIAHTMGQLVKQLQEPR